MDHAFAIPWPTAALATSSGDAAFAAELSVVSLLDGVIGDPVTWIDQPGPSAGDGRGPTRRAREFRSVAEDIRAHLPDGAVVVHGAGSNLALIRRILPLWQPAMVLDTLSLAKRAGLTPSWGPCTLDNPDPNSGSCGAAGRALATARLLLRLTDALPGLGFAESSVSHPA
ncbi:hypothetical protein GCM10009839_58300 [Catenulispora yoronensis]|uniref:Uncharacterized protein n=1 Tax=Catenulispora yoronensis TaxID=450799 RepID=A0ABN2UZW1_9ACTN